MDELCHLINIPTSELKSDIIQKALFLIQKNSRSDEMNSPVWEKLLQVLWDHLKLGLTKFDDQLLCATCFYSVPIPSNQQWQYSNQVYKIVALQLTNYRKQNMVTSQVVSLMYGMFQSTFLVQYNGPQMESVGQILEVMLELLIDMAYAYSKFTFIAFKTINSFKKVIGTKFQEIVYSEDNNIKLLNLVNHNWENPVTGIRDLNREIFKTLISVIDEEKLKIIFKEINDFYWNKAKYLMLSEIIEQSNNNIIMQNNNWIKGLTYSLHKPGLVSAGTDMYFAILKKIHTPDQWCDLFLEVIIQILNGTSKATENFCNYWSLITLKRFPSLFNVFIEILTRDFHSEKNIFSRLYLTKQACKVGNKCFNSDGNKQVIELKTIGLSHCNSHIRKLAFDVLCSMHVKAKFTKSEYDLVLSFLNDNINSDCTVLRISMLNSFNGFLTQIHMSCSNKGTEFMIDNDVLEFCIKFQEFIIASLSINGNYQRKITCVKLANLFFNNLNEIPKKRLKQTRNKSKTIIEDLKERNQLLLLATENVSKLIHLLNDPAEDLRENVAELLLTHYFQKLQTAEIMNSLIENALTKLKSKFFYEIGCGQSMFKLIIKLLLKTKYEEAKFKSVEDIFSFAYNQLISEHKLKRDTLDAIENGTQLHSFMSILCNLLQVCHLSEYHIDISASEMNDLLDSLDNISNQFAWEQKSSTSSDFSKMSEMVEDMINKSRNAVDNDKTKISGLHQIVLNCLWLNVKGSCDLAELLIKYVGNNSGQVEVCERSLCIITRVLETCRHKGAIEAAGVALDKSIRYLTSLPDGSDLTKIPSELLKNKINDLISDANNMASITRRGAGLSIMVHRIVSSDMQKGKPLFHYLMTRILEVCNQTEDTISSNGDIDNERDLPKAIYIHFLTRIVTDSSLASDTMFYSADLAELAFHNLINPYWQIRNAALQLYGALITKLIGQKKASGLGKETVATVACDELRTHSKKMWLYMLDKLNVSGHNDKVQYHSNLVPILNILANIARRYNFKWNIMEQHDIDMVLLRNLFCLLDSPIHAVRRLAAKSIYNIYSFDSIYDILIKNDNFSENCIHGCLMLLSNCFKIYCNTEYKHQFDDLKAKYENVIKISTHCYLNHQLFEDVFPEECDILEIKHTIEKATMHSHEPGVHLWANMRVTEFVNKCSWNEICEILPRLLICEEREQYCNSVLQKIENEKEKIASKTLIDIANILVTFEDKFNSTVIWHILYKLSQMVNLNIYVTRDVWQILEKDIVPYKLRYIIPFLSRILSSKQDNEYLIKISNIIVSLTISENTDVEMRLIAAMANNELGFVFNNLSDFVKMSVIKSVVILLQDEDEYVRNESVMFYKNVKNLDFPLNPFVCLFKILDSEFLQVFHAETATNFVTDMTNLLNSNFLSHDNDEYNPFSNETTNIYIEPDILKRLIDNIKI